MEKTFTKLEFRLAADFRDEPLRELWSSIENLNSGIPGWKKMIYLEAIDYRLPQKTWKRHYWVLISDIFWVFLYFLEKTYKTTSIFTSKLNETSVNLSDFVRPVVYISAEYCDLLCHKIELVNSAYDTIRNPVKPPKHLGKHTDNNGFIITRANKQKPSQTGSLIVNTTIPDLNNNFATTIKRPVTFNPLKKSSQWFKDLLEIDQITKSSP